MRQFTFDNGANVQNIRITPKEEAPGLWMYQVDVSFKDPTVPGKVQILWHEPISGLTQVWCPIGSRAWMLTQWWNARVNSSRLAFGAPVMSLFWQGGQNYRTVALSEAELPASIRAAANDYEEKDLLDLSVTLFEKNPPGQKEYTFRLRIDERPMTMVETVGEVSLWWQQLYPKKKECSPWAEVPLYSSWYNCHQNPTQERLEKDLELAAEAGFRSMIIDDGWSYDDPASGGYSECGTWEIALSKFPDFKGFMARAHALGIKVMLWFSVPFVGWNNPDFERWKDKLLDKGENFHAGVLDPRYPDVRKYIVDTYKVIVEKYDLDGLKLDFIDSFYCESVELKPGMDCAAVEDGINRLLQEIDDALMPDRPEFMMEYRQNYTGPSITRYGDMLRVGDCAYDPITNRIGILDLRTLNYPLAVHADMFIWSRNEDPAVCARMLQNTLFSVPQISIMLHEAPESHRQVIGRYVHYWDSHRALLVHGKLTAMNPEANYTAAYCEDETMRIAALYSRNEFVYDGKDTDLFNATERDYVILAAKADCKAVCVDCFGKTLWEKDLNAGAHWLDVPSAAMVQIRK